MKKTLIIDIISGLFILLFLYTGLMKLTTITTFIHTLEKSPLLKEVSPILGWAIPLWELVTVVALLMPGTRRKGLISSAIMMAIFTVYVGFMLYFRSERPCTCGGVIQQMNWHQHFYFNTLFTLLALVALRLEKKNKNASDNLNSVQYIS